MYDFLLQLSFISGLAVIIYLMARALPRVANGETPKTFYDYLEQWLDKLPVHKLDQRLNQHLFKFLKKTRVVVMRMDNKLAESLIRIKRNGENSNGNSVADLINQANDDKSNE